MSKRKPVNTWCAIIIPKTARDPYIRANKNWKRKRLYIAVVLWRTQKQLAAYRPTTARRIACCATPRQHAEGMPDGTFGQRAAVAELHFTLADLRYRYVVHEVTHYMKHYERVYRRHMGRMLPEENLAAMTDELFVQVSKYLEEKRGKPLSNT